MDNEILIQKSLLNEQDKINLINMIKLNNFPKNINNLSIFSQKGKINNNNDYITYEYDCTLYYISKLNIWIDEEYKLLSNSNWWYCCDIIKFINHINHYINIINNINLTNILVIEKNVVAIQKWFNTYGHFMDELFTLKNYIINNKDYIPIFSFPLEMEDNIYATGNYKIICEMLFNKDYVNLFNNNITKINKLILIKHYITDNTFHKFPIYISDLIKNKILYSLPKMNSNDYLFITRNKSVHLSRNLDNQKEIEEYLLTLHVNIINPEEITFNELILQINSHTNIIITWGSALVNLVFCPLYSNIIILKSKSYEHECIDLFKKIIDDRYLNIKIIVHDNNNIKPCDII